SLGRRCVYVTGIIITELEDFDIRHILDCGQIFRYEKLSEGEYKVYSKDKTCLVRQSQDNAVIESDDPEYFVNYFDLGRDYGEIKQKLKGKPFMDEAMQYGHGIRILNQDKWEMLISFIISANNHIPRIKGIIGRLCASLGKNMGDYYAFPTPEAMASKDEEFYKALGAGYRAKYLAITSRQVADGFDLDAIDCMDGNTANKKLCTLMGVGSKVADCILLFGYHKQDVFPVDTWIKKVYKDVVGDDIDNNNIIRRKLIDIYGEYSGYAQQYLFFNKREN
ncbi:MAG: 8-oxoguanine DNA glycosylase, partial [Clostridia bacterium]|nr:8-oxoguanine DNA glycosylase [Clostridia bacterium]